MAGGLKKPPQREVFIRITLSVAVQNPLSRSRASQNRADQARELSDPPKL